MNSVAPENWTCRDCQHVEAHAEPGARCPGCDTVLVPAIVLRAKRMKDDAVLGRVVGGKYAVFGVLGTGGFGAVYRAVQEPVGRLVALKVIRTKFLNDEQNRARYFREAKAVARLNDPTVVTLYDYGEEEGIGLYTAFELVDGKTLSPIVKSGPQEPVWTTHVLLQILRALSEAHRQGMVHRDIKPGNIMVVAHGDGDERVRLLDFGIAKVRPKENQDASIETQDGLVLGTPRFMAPEQARASDRVDARADLYSLAVVGYALLTGKNPFERTTHLETIMAHCTEPVPPFDPALNIPPALEVALTKALQKNPEDRFASASEMIQALQGAFPDIAFPSTSIELRSASHSGAMSVSGAFGRVNSDISLASRSVSQRPASLSAPPSAAFPEPSALAESGATWGGEPTRPFESVPDTAAAHVPKSSRRRQAMLIFLGLFLGIGLWLGTTRFMSHGSAPVLPRAVDPPRETVVPPVPPTGTVKAAPDPKDNAMKAAPEPGSDSMKTEPTQDAQAKTVTAPAKPAVKTPPRRSKPTRSRPPPRSPEPKKDPAPLDVPEF